MQYLLSYISPLRTGSVIAVAALLAIAGCGSSSGEGSEKTYSVQASTTMSTAELTKPQFLRRMNKTCREAWVTVIDNFAQFTDGQTSADGAAGERFAEAVQTSLISGLVFHIFDNFRILGAPPGEEESIEAIIGPFQYAAESIWAEEPPEIRSTDEIVRRFADYNRLARPYGLDDCLVTEARLQPVGEA